MGALRHFWARLLKPDPEVHEGTEDKHSLGYRSKQATTGYLGYLSHENTSEDEDVYKVSGCLCGNASSARFLEKVPFCVFARTHISFYTGRKPAFLTAVKSDWYVRLSLRMYTKNFRLSEQPSWKKPSFPLNNDHNCLKRLQLIKKKRLLTCSGGELSEMTAQRDPPHVTYPSLTFFSYVFLSPQ